MTLQEAKKAKSDKIKKAKGQKVPVKSFTVVNINETSDTIEMNVEVKSKEEMEEKLLDRKFEKYLEQIKHLYYNKKITTLDNKEKFIPIMADMFCTLNNLQNNLPIPNSAFSNQWNKKDLNFYKFILEQNGIKLGERQRKLPVHNYEINKTDSDVGLLVYNKCGRTSKYGIIVNKCLYIMGDRFESNESKTYFRVALLNDDFSDFIYDENKKIIVTNWDYFNIEVVKKFDGVYDPTRKDIDVKRSNELIDHVESYIKSFR